MLKDDIADCMYILYEGKVNIYGDKECTIFIAEQKPNKVFGEQALLQEGAGKRSASIVATEKVKLLRLAKTHVQDHVVVIIDILYFIGCEKYAKTQKSLVP